MCEAASLVITTDKVFWSLKSDAHEEIIREFGLKDEVANRITLVRVEITPPNGDWAAPLCQWQYKVDQDLLPEWYEKDPDKQESRARAALKYWFSAKVFLSGNHTIHDQQAYCFGNSTATLWGNSTATLYDNSTATLCDNSTATLWGNSTATLYGNSTATLCDNSTATLCDNSTATLCDNSTATLWGNSTATLHDNSTATLHDNSTATLCGNSTATLWGNSTATLYGNSTVIGWSYKNITLNSLCAVLVDRRGDVPKFRHGKKTVLRQTPGRGGTGV
jgi:phage gp45-like